jgi:hypothetical protein
MGKSLSISLYERERLIEALHEREWLIEALYERERLFPP